ncbi:MAG: sugar-binding protein [Planctomycetes bacterium]|nr:sugar-binding protein [Planctomycetota bacterium]MCB9917954.1 sugar-binding protein [Planctomycetota bacterium]
MSRSFSRRSLVGTAIAFFGTILLASCNKPAGGGQVSRFAFVTNGADPFWDIAKRGALDAGQELGVRVDVLIPTGGITEQTQMLEDLITQGVTGVAVSPIAPENQTPLLDRLAESSLLVTHDSDAPDAKRICYIGTDNYVAGRACGKLVKEAVPDGGKVMLFIGRLEQANARQRRQGVIDELLGYSNDKTRFSSVDEVLTEGKWTILGTLTDQFDRARAKAGAEDTLTKHDDVACLVGLFAYNAPACLEALRASQKSGKVAVVAFDEDKRTLQAIEDGDVFGTIVQDPYGYGNQSIKMLAAIARGDRSGVPESGIRYLAVRTIRKADVAGFRKQLESRLSAR